LKSTDSNDQTGNFAESEIRSENVLPIDEAQPTNKDSACVDNNLQVENLDEDINDEESRKSIVEDNLDDTNSFVEESSNGFSTSSTATGIQLSESQYYLKDNYEKAKRERELEQEQAEMEKKRLQEILDICMEFQLQEKVKSENGGSTSHLSDNALKSTKSSNGSLQKTNFNSINDNIKTSSSTSSSLSTSSNSSHNILEENAQSSSKVQTIIEQPRKNFLLKPQIIKLYLNNI